MTLHRDALLVMFVVSTVLYIGLAALSGLRGRGARGPAIVIAACAVYLSAVFIRGAIVGDPLNDSLALATSLNVAIVTVTLGDPQRVFDLPTRDEAEISEMSADDRAALERRESQVAHSQVALLAVLFVGIVVASYIDLGVTIAP